MRECGLDVLPRNYVFRVLSVVLQALLKKLDMILARRKGVRLSSKLIPKLSYENQLFL
jgi:hypothetical protein